MSQDHTGPQPDPMPVADEPTYLGYGDGELLELAQATLQTALAATAAHLRAAGADPAAWVAALGAAFARGWDEPEPWTPAELVDAAAVNLVALGAEVVKLDASGDPATLRTRGFPDPELCGRVGADVADVLVYLDALGQVARERGVAWSWRREGDEAVCLASVAAPTP